MMGMPGEEVVCDDNLVWITKTHYPGPMWKRKFHSQKMIVIVRNPIDVFPSFASLLNCCSHSLVPEQSYDELHGFWDAWVKLGAAGVKSNHNAVLRIADEIPTYYMRFEDMRTDPVSTLLDCFKFLLDTPNIEGTVVEKRIQENCGLKNEPKSIYKLKSKSLSLSRN